MVAGKSPAGLPSGWRVLFEVKHGRTVKYYSNVETGQKFYSKKDTIRYAEMGNVCCGTPQPVSKHNKGHSENESMPIVLKTNESPEWLPHGWIMELKTRKSGLQIGTNYKCYIDPATGCKFYSKPEVSRYLETVKHNGSTENASNIKFDRVTRSKSSLKPGLSQDRRTINSKSCISEQKKSHVDTHSMDNVVVERASSNELPPGWIKEIKTRKSVNGIKKYPSPSAFDGKNLTRHVTRRQRFAGKRSCNTSSLVAPDDENSKRRQCSSVTADTTVISTLSAEILEENFLRHNAIEKFAERKESSDSKTKASQGKVDMTVFTENGSVSSPVIDILQGKELLVEGMEKHSSKRTQRDLSKSKNKRALSLPVRSSKRLAGLEPEILANLSLGERAFRAALRKSGETEAKPSVDLTQDAAAHRETQQPEAEPETEIAHQASREKEAPSHTEPSNKGDKPLEDQAVPEEHPRLQEIEKLHDENPEAEDLQLFCPFGDSWLDPCLEFAFKTLTGAVPVEDNLAIHGYFQQQFDTSNTQIDGCLALPEFGSPCHFQNDVSSHFDALDKPASVQQSAANPTILAPGHVSLPSCRGIGPQQSSLEAGAMNIKQS